MNTFLLAAVAIGLVAFLVIKRKRQAAAGAGPAAERAPRTSRSRGRAKTRRDGTIQGYPDAAPEAPAAAAMAETAASRTLSPVLEPLPPAAPAPPAEPSGAVSDWGFDEMIVEPGWPMPGEIAGTWPAGPPAAGAPVAASAAVQEPVAVDDAAAPQDEVADAATGEWTVSGATRHAAAEPEPVDAVPQPEAAYAEAGAEPAMEAWVPGVSEVEPVMLPDAPAPAVDPEPVLVWADPAPAADVGLGGDAFPTDEVAAGPPAWQPEALAEPEAVEEPEPAEEPDAVDEPEPVDALLPAWGPESETASPPAVVALDEPWQPAMEPAIAVVDADPRDQVDAVAEGLPLAVATLTPVLAAGDALGVTPRMAAVLRALADEPRGLPDLGRALGVSRPVVADVCARLEDLELVWRERDPDDRRRMIVVPTPKGLKLADEAVPGLDRAAVAGALDRLSPAERAALVAAVRVLREVR